MAYPASVATRIVRAGVPRDVTWQPRAGSVTLTPLITAATHLASGDLIVPTPVTLELLGDGATASAEIIASDSPGLTVVDFDWQVDWAVDHYARSARVRIPRWTGTGAAPVVDLGALAPVPAASGGAVLVPFVTPDQLRSALDSISVGTGAKVHVQAAAAAQWIIPHTLGRPPGVAVIIDGEQQYPDVASTATNVTITMPTARTGTAILT